jgi:regulator of sirC expression with transglutaminase-like and TPR domain
MKKVVFASMLVVATMVPAAAPAALAQAQGSQSSQITIKDPAEYNAYTNAIGQSTPAAKAAAIESFLEKYPNSVVKQEMLEQLVGAYQATGDTAKTYEAARKLLQVDPTNLRALTFVVYVEKAQANGDQAKLDDAAANAQRGLTATKPASMSDADFEKLKG